MFHSFKTVSCQHIISKIARTFKPSDSTWIIDAVEDIGWGIQAIGYHAGFEKKSTEYPYIKVTNHRGKIPCDVERLQHVEALIVDKTSNNILNPDGTTPDDVNEVDCPVEYKGIKLTLSSDTSLASISEKSPRTTNMDTSPLENTYQVNGDYVVTQFASGLIKLHYIGFIIDKNGLPCVIDDFDYKSCLEFYCISQMMFRGFKHPELSYKDAFATYEMYRLRAENACKMMGLDEAERFQASFNRYVQSINFPNSFYAGLEQQEYIDR